MQNRASEAVACFNGGFNCAQAVFSTYCGQFSLEQETALRVACGLGGGMGKLQETCGAVSGAYLVIGLKHGQYLPGDTAAKETTYALVREFARRFEERNQSTSCRALLGIDLMDCDREIAAARVKQVCPNMVRDAVEILEALFS